MATTMLVCKQCNFENEPERVYCHNCGAKLDRSLLPPEATKRQDPAMVQERVRKMVRPRNVSSTQQLKNFVTSVVIAALLAAIILIARAPDGIPNLAPEAVMDAPTISDDMDANLSGTTPRRMIYTEDQVNAFLAASIRGKENAAATLALKFEKAYVHFDDGDCRITQQLSLFGFSFYATTADAVEIQKGALVTRSLYGSLGRLRISEKLMPYVGRGFAPLWKVLERDRKLVAALQSITFHKGTVEMITRPAGAR